MDSQRLQSSVLCILKITVFYLRNVKFVMFLKSFQRGQGLDPHRLLWLFATQYFSKLHFKNLSKHHYFKKNFHKPLSKFAKYHFKTILRHKTLLKLNFKYTSNAYFEGAITDSIIWRKNPLQNFLKIPFLKGKNAFSKLKI